MLGIFDKKEEKNKKKKAVKPVKEEAAPVAKSDQPVITGSSNLISRSHVSEKSSRLTGESNQYMFRVRGDANKNEIRKQIEKMYSVKVLKVRIVNVPEKKRTLGRNQGIKQGYKKAIVSVQPGQTINSATA